MIHTQKIFLSPFFLTLAVFLGLGIGAPNALAQQAAFFKEQCKENECCLQYTQAMGAAEADWNSYVNDLLAQPQATSKKVDRAFEGLRTYDCWIRYTCEAVRASALLNPERIGVRLSKKDLGGGIPGCQTPGNIQFGNNWDAFVSALNDQNDLIAAVNPPSKVAFLPACMSNPPFNTPLNNQDTRNAQLKYQNCLATAEVILGCTRPECQNTPSALAGLEAALKKDHARQKASALERKLQDLNQRTAIMEAVAEQVKNLLQSLNLRYVCAPLKCT